jgi:methanogenic corrinoid protein MtbC1
MHPLYKEFVALLDRKDKDGCVDLILSKLSSKEIDIVTLYNEVLTPSLNMDFCKGVDKGFCIWEEHIRTSIVRTILECSYPFIVKERDERYGEAKGDKVIVVCPTEEYHEIGPRMVADFFTLCGFDVTFVGANTPQEEIIDVISHIGPKYVALSVTSYYNLVAARRTVDRISKVRRKMEKEDRFRIIVGGNAFRRNSKAFKDIGADLLLQTFEDIRKLAGGG